ncbi:aldehyde dehydrogenase family protein [Amycolatopsis taiwanensis]|uniref:aldehyde dehydrogenase family protein n=1 Tax=Amycolatopsis taiwanensis TaxID=342230 RepID=UPI0025571B7C|nr:aldehyde dehydrogenase family protein [Amycolatopsis taiwanensis]
MSDRGLLLGGDVVDGTDLRPVLNPADGTLVARYAAATSADVDRAVADAHERGRAWTLLHPDERARILRRGAEAIREHVDEIARVLTLEQGKPLPDSVKEILFGASVFEYYAEEGRRVHGSLRPTASAGTMSMVSYHPVGVVAGIVPWNYPVDLYAWKVAPALAAGCPVVVKPPEEAPLAIGMVSRLLVDAGLPPGALADLPGGADVGRRLAAHPDIALVTATCSTATGKAIMRAAAEHLTRVSLELGGHCPLVVLPDADLELAARAAARRSFSNMGQICIAVNRVIVLDGVADAFVDALRSEVAAYVLGDPSVPGVGYGPCTTAQVVEKARSHVADAVARGAQLVIGGSEPDGEQFAAGHYFLPTVLDHVPSDALVMTEETFGPVLAVHRVSTIGEAIAVANATDYGLAAYVYGEDLGQALAVAEQIEAGGVGVNVNDVSELQAPFGGWKQSGLGRELGPEGLHAYLETRHTKVRRPAIAVDR